MSPGPELELGGIAISLSLTLNTYYIISLSLTLSITPGRVNSYLIVAELMKYVFRVS
jgi:hypothetical protein